MDKGLKVKIAIAATFVILSCLLSFVVSKAVLKDYETKVTNEIAMEQMQIEQNENAISYEAYRNARNDLITYVPIATGAIVIVFLGVLFFPEIVGMFKKSEE